MSAAAQHPHRQDARAGRACVPSHRPDGRQVAAHHRPGAGELCDDDDGGLLQPKAAGLSPEGRNRGLLAPAMGRIAGARGDLRQNQDEMAGDGGDSP